MPFEYFQRVIFLNITVDESENLLFLFDTGAEVSSIDEQTLYKLDLPFIRTGFLERNGTPVNLAFVKAEKLQAGNASIRNMDLAVENLGYMPGPAGRHIDGILGTDFLKYFTVEIDFVKHKISFSKNSECTGGYIPFEMDNNIPKIKVTINDTIHTFLRYESGSSLFNSDSTFASAETESWIALQQGNRGYYTASNSSGMVPDIEKFEAVPVRTFFFVGQKIKYPYLFVQPGQGYLVSPHSVGFFGNNLLEKFERVSIDFPANRICFPGKE